jgi:hypothetical protein
MNLLEKGIGINYKKKMSERASFLFGSILILTRFVSGLIGVAHVMRRDIEVAEIGLYGSERRFKRV